MVDIFSAGLIILLVVLAMNLGVFTLYAHTIMPGLKSLSDKEFINVFQSIDRRITNPIFMSQFFVPLLLFIGLGIYSFTVSLSTTGFIVTGFISYVTTVVLTLAINVPLNDGIKKVATAQLTDKLLALERAKFNEPRWVSANVARSFSCLISLICIALAI